MGQEQDTSPAPANEAGATELDQLRKELEAAQAKAAENLEGWQRERATFANYKRRTEKDQADMQQNAATRVLGRFLEVLDDFERALKDRPTENDSSATWAKWAEGTQMIHRKLQAALDAENVARIEALGKPFDPQQHEAITHEESSEHPSGHVIDVVRNGYKAGERVIRPALVRVAK